MTSTVDIARGGTDITDERARRRIAAAYHEAAHFVAGVACRGMSSALPFCRYGATTRRILLGGVLPPSAPCALKYIPIGTTPLSTSSAERSKKTSTVAIYLALGMPPDGTRDILGLWIESTEGAKFWLKVFNDLKTRCVADILPSQTR